jgi:hypothetical protein
MAKERMRNEDARGGDVIVQDSVASGTPDLPIDEDPERERDVAIDAGELGGRPGDQTNQSPGSD